MSGLVEGLVFKGKVEIGLILLYEEKEKIRRFRFLRRGTES
jgi:hypothetical protein